MMTQSDMVARLQKWSVERLLEHAGWQHFGHLTKDELIELILNEDDGTLEELLDLESSQLFLLFGRRHK